MVPELVAHGAVEDKVDGAVDERQQVQDVAHGAVDVEELRVEGAQDQQHALGQLGQPEDEHDAQQHQRRPVLGQQRGGGASWQNAWGCSRFRVSQSRRKLSF